MLRSGTAAVVVAIVAVCCMASVHADKLSDLKTYDRVTIKPLETLRQGRYTRELFRHDKQFSFTISTFDSTYRFDVSPDTDLFTLDFEAAVYENGVKIPHDMSDRTYYKGYVNRNTSQPCHFRVDNKGTVHGAFNADGDRYKVDPAEHHFDNMDGSFNHIVYRLSDHKNADLDLPSHCGVVNTPNSDKSQARSRSRRAAFDASNTVCSIAFVADSLFFENIGDSDVSRTIDIMTQRFADVQAVYQDDNDIADMNGVKIGIRIGYFEITSGNTDPYNDGQSFNGDGEAYLRHVSTDPNSDTSGSRFEDFCVTHILTYQDFDNGLLGLAWVGSTGSSPGGLCQQEATLSGQLLTTNTGFSTQINFNQRVPDLTVYLVMAHEIGHNFGCQHDDDNGLADGQYLMYPVSVDGSRPNNFIFSSLSLDSMAAVISAKGGCFIPSSMDSCGNGIQEGSEECDCGVGSASLCAAIDSCCQTNCTLSGGNVCSPRHSQNGACCTEGCAFKPADTECRPSGPCTLQSNCTAMGECPAAASRADNTVCGGSFVCQSGLCDTSICSLWGLEEVLVEDSCFVYCNMSGTPTKTSDISVMMQADGLDNDGNVYTFPMDGAVRDAGRECLRSDGLDGVCDDQGACVQADGGNIFNNIKDLIDSFSVSDALDWFFRTDNYIPNYGWVAIGAGLLIILISICCCVSNKLDKSHGIT